MPQTFQVLRCYKCKVFQVHPTKKSNKWKCKLCDEKQSIKRFYGLGTGRECRIHVQKLNGIRGEIHDADEHTDISSVSELSDHSEQDEITPCSSVKKSKWLEYMDERNEKNIIIEETNTISNKTMHCHNKEIVLELPRKNPRKLIIGSNKTATKPENDDGLVNNSVENNLIKSIASNTSNVTNTGHIENVEYVDAEKATKNSKWSKFVEEDKSNQKENNLNSIIHDQSRCTFPFLEDENIDLFLDL